MTFAPGFRIPPRYRAKGVAFDGSNDYLTRGSDFTGSADSKVGILSFWMKKGGGDGTLQRIFRNTGGYLEVFLNTSNKLSIGLYDAAVTAAFDVTTTTTTITADGLWHEILVSWDAATATIQLYIDDVSTALTHTTASNNVNINYTQPEWAVGANTTGSDKINMSLADFYFNMVTSIDLSSATNRALFRDPSGRPTFLGATGQLPTGTAPILFLSGAAATFATNLGGGGGMTTTGTLDNTTSPSD